MFLSLVQSTGPMVLVFLLLVSVALVGTVVGLVQGLRQKTPAWWLALAPLSAVLVMMAFNIEHATAECLSAIATARPEMKQTLMAAAMSKAMGGNILGLGALHLPGLALLIACIAVGARRPDGLWSVLAAAALVVAATVFSGVGGLMAQTPPLRSIGVLVYGVMVLPAMLGTSSSARMAGATAAAALPLLVVGLEGQGIALGQVQVFEVTASASPDAKATLFDSGLDLVTRSRPWGMAAVLSALGVTSLGCLRAPEGGGALFALACVAPLPLLFDTTPVLQMLQSSSPGVL